MAIDDRSIIIGRILGVGRVHAPVPFRRIVHVRGDGVQDARALDEMALPVADELVCDREGDAAAGGAPDGEVGGWVAVQAGGVGVGLYT